MIIIFYYWTNNIKINNSKNLKIIGRAGVGLDNIDLESAKEKKLVKPV